MNIDRKTKGLAVLSLVLVAAIASGILLTTQATSAAATSTNLQSNLNTQLAVVTTTASDTTNSTDTVTGDASITIPFWGEVPQWASEDTGEASAVDAEASEPIEVSDEYKTAITTIAENDMDVQQLLADGYNVTRVLPIVKQ